MDSDSKTLWRRLYPRFRDAKQRLDTEADLEERLDLPAGSVSIHCPEREMNLKRFEMLVQTSPDSEIKMFSDILDEPRRAEMDALNTRFEQLWALQVFVDPDVLDPQQVSNARASFGATFCCLS